MCWDMVDVGSVTVIFYTDDDDFDPEKGFINKDEKEEWKDEDKDIEKVITLGCLVL